jgi:hypothetical protein
MLRNHFTILIFSGVWPGKGNRVSTAKSWTQEARYSKTIGNAREREGSKDHRRRFLEGVFELSDGTDLGPFSAILIQDPVFVKFIRRKVRSRTPTICISTNNRAISLGQILYCTSSRVSEKISH